MLDALLVGRRTADTPYGVTDDENKHGGRESAAIWGDGGHAVECAQWRHGDRRGDYPIDDLEPCADGPRWRTTPALRRAKAPLPRRGTRPAPGLRCRQSLCGPPWSARAAQPTRQPPVRTSASGRDSTPNTSRARSSTTFLEPSTSSGSRRPSHTSRPSSACRPGWRARRLSVTACWPRSRPPTRWARRIGRRSRRTAGGEAAGPRREDHGRAARRGRGHAQARGRVRRARAHRRPAAGGNDTAHYGATVARLLRSASQSLFKRDRRIARGTVEVLVALIRELHTGQKGRGRVAGPNPPCRGAASAVSWVPAGHRRGHRPDQQMGITPARR